MLIAGLDLFWYLFISWGNLHKLVSMEDKILATELDWSPSHNEAEISKVQNSSQNQTKLGHNFLLRSRRPRMKTGNNI